MVDSAERNFVDAETDPTFRKNEEGEIVEACNASWATHWRNSQSSVQLNDAVLFTPDSRRDKVKLLFFFYKCTIFETIN